MEEYTFYEIKCLNPEITENYIGHTKNFIRRKWEHHSRYKTGVNWKLYNTIAINGGWDNWTMVIINTQLLSSKLDACKYEQLLIDERKTTLNVDSAFATDEKKKQNSKNNYYKHRDKRMESSNKWKEENAEQVKEYTKKYKEKNRDIINQKQREKRALQKKEKEILLQDHNALNI